jgi:hypothetical protein
MSTRRREIGELTQILLSACVLSLLASGCFFGGSGGKVPQADPLADRDSELASLKIVYTICSTITQCHPNADYTNCRLEVMDLDDLDNEVGVPVETFDRYKYIVDAEEVRVIWPDLTALTTCLNEIEQISCASMEMQRAFGRTQINPYSGVPAMIPAGSNSCPAVFDN